MHALDSLLFLIPLIHLLLAPHTKVEESFNLQATHDILVYGTPITFTSTSNANDTVGHRLAATYDHFSFPGAVPRTFVGPVLLAGLGQPLVALVGFAHAQLVVRAILGAFNAASLLVFRRALARAFGEGVARWWVLLVVSQFHVVYYLTRTLPNMFAFGLTTIALAFILPQPNPRKTLIRQKQAIGLLVLATTIFRSELAILLSTTTLYLVFGMTTTATAGGLQGKIKMLLNVVAPVFLVSFAASLALSVPLDSYFWQKPLWPELWGFYYNAILGSSSEWGVSPWHWYFTSALPRIFLNPLAIPLMAFALLQPGISRQARITIIPSLLFIAIYSLQPHKETRFIFYAIPPLTGTAALAANFIFTRRSKSFVYGPVSLALGLSILATFTASLGMLLLSSLNYPGGDALTQLYAITHNDTTPSVTIHADVLTCMTGLTLFGQNRAGLPLALNGFSQQPKVTAPFSPVFFFDKTEDETMLAHSTFWIDFDYALMEDTTLVQGTWDEIGEVHGYDGIEFLRPGQIPAHLSSSQNNKDEYRKVLGLGATVANVRDSVRSYTGGWWIGPRMAPRIHIMKQVRE